MKGIILMTVMLIKISTSQVTESSCENGVKFTVVAERQIFDEATLTCQSRNATLAILPDKATTDAANDFLNRINAEATWIGLSRVADIDLGDSDPRDPSTFSFIDGTSFVDGFASVRGELPWRDDRPNNLLENEACVRIVDATREWDDIFCGDARSVLCTSPCDVEVTNIPTFSPSSSPSLSPTLTPSKSPSLLRLTSSPSLSPTQSASELSEEENQEFSLLIPILAIVITAFSVIALVFGVIIYSKKKQQKRENHLFQSYSTMVSSFKGSARDHDRV